MGVLHTAVQMVLVTRLRVISTMLLFLWNCLTCALASQRFCQLSGTARGSCLRPQNRVEQKHIDDGSVAELCGQFQTRIPRSKIPPVVTDSCDWSLSKGLIQYRGSATPLMPRSQRDPACSQPCCSVANGLAAAWRAARPREQNRLQRSARR